MNSWRACALGDSSGLPEGGLVSCIIHTSVTHINHLAPRGLCNFHDPWFLLLYEVTITTKTLINSRHYSAQSPKIKIHVFTSFQYFKTVWKKIQRKGALFLNTKKLEKYTASVQCVSWTQLDALGLHSASESHLKPWNFLRKNIIVLLHWETQWPKKYNVSQRRTVYIITAKIPQVLLISHPDQQVVHASWCTYCWIL